MPQRGNMVMWDMAAAACVLLPLLAIVVVAASHHAPPLPVLLDGAAFYDPKDKVVEYNYIRNFLELASFAAGVCVMLVAIVAYLFSREQFMEARNQTRQLIAQNKEAERARFANVYMQISAAWNSGRVLQGKLYILTLEQFFRNDRAAALQALGGAGPVIDVQDYIRQVLEKTKQTDVAKFSGDIAVLSYLEDLGLLCRRGYARDEDVLDFMGSPIIKQMDLLSRYIDGVRANNSTNYENALYLLGKAKAFRGARAKSLADHAAHAAAGAATPAGTP